MHHHGTDGRWHMSYGIKLVLSLIYEDYILTCISNQIPLYSTRCNYLFMPNYVNDLTMQQILACLQSPIAFSSVCLSVGLFHDTGHTVTAINTKLGTFMELVSGYQCILFGVNDVTDDITRSKSRSNFEIALTLNIWDRASIKASKYRE